MSTSTQPPIQTPEDGFVAAVPDTVWTQLSKVAQEALLQLAVQQSGSLAYSKRQLAAFEELEKHNLVYRSRTPAEGRQWTLNTHAIALLHALPDSEDVRLKWIRSLHQRET